MAWCYVDEIVEVLAAWASGLQEALVGLGEGDFVIVDGILIPTDRIAADEPNYSQKHKHHGMNVQVIARPDGTPLWFCRALPGRTHDLTAARAHGTIQARLTRHVLDFIALVGDLTLGEDLAGVGHRGRQYGRGFGSRAGSCRPPRSPVGHRPVRRL